MLCVEWWRQDRSTWIIGPRLRVMQNKKHAKEKKWGAVVVIRAFREKKRNKKKKERKRHKKWTESHLYYSLVKQNRTC